jgi:hypothetical protein
VREFCVNELCMVLQIGQQTPGNKLKYKASGDPTRDGKSACRWFNRGA